MLSTVVFRNSIPVLPALNIPKTIAFYERQLGFTKKFEFDDYASLVQGGIELHLWLCHDPEIPKNSACRINVEGIEILYEQYRRAGVIHPDGKLVRKAWGFKEFVVLDLNGNAICFAEPIANF